MLRLHALRLNSIWFEALEALFADISILGHKLFVEDGWIRVESEVPLERHGDAARKLWRSAHEHLHRADLIAHVSSIEDFEANAGELFIEGGNLDLDSIAPTLEPLNFQNPVHAGIASYLQLYQTVPSRDLPGRKMGLIAWDDGQAGRRPLIGGVLLCSPRYYQPARDTYLQWPPRAADSGNVRRKGLDRVQHLAVVCALPPYARLSAAWLLAMAPFTATAQVAFAEAAAGASDPDLAAVVTTTSMDMTGTPFQRHRIGRLAGSGMGAHTLDGGGDLYKRLVSPTLLRARFEGLISGETFRRLCRLHEAEDPGGISKLHDRFRKHLEQAEGTRRRIAVEPAGVLRERLNRASLSFFLRRLGLHRSLFDGNDMGVHLGAVGADTLAALRTGRPRPDRPVLDWSRAVEEWKSKFTDNPIVQRQIASNDQERRINAIRKRREYAQSTTILDAKLSAHLGGSA
jgi:hypothetical protein